MRDAINEIVGMLNVFPQIFKFEIVDVDNFSIHYSIGDEFYQKQFSDTVKLLEWCENNLITKE